MHNVLQCFLHDYVMIWDATNFLWMLQTFKGFFVIFIDATISTVKDVDIYVIWLLMRG